MSGGQEADVSLLQREGGPQEAVSPTLGEASRSLWTAARLHSLFCRLAPCNLGVCTDHLLSIRPEIGISLYGPKFYLCTSLLHEVNNIFFNTIQHVKLSQIALRSSGSSRDLNPGPSDY